MIDVLFILKRRNDYNPNVHNQKSLSTGLYNSADFMNDMLNQFGIISELEVAIDNNCIDRLVTKHKPKYVIVEALWVTPSKFEVLSKLHPNVRWIIRLHSEMPFIAGEGMAIDWLGDYITYSTVDIATNSPRMLSEVREFLKGVTNFDQHTIEQRVFYLPNYYPKIYKKKAFDKNKPYIDIACFGAVRPLKNHLLQAVAAIKFANKIQKKLRFHINGGRVEGKGDTVMKNLKCLFQHLDTAGHELIIHEWAPRDEFLKICQEVDIGLQVNFSETFNIVSADLITQGVPIIGTSEIPWSSCLFNSLVTDSDHIAKVLYRTYHFPQINVYLNQTNLDKYTDKTEEIWEHKFGKNIYAS